MSFPIDERTLSQIVDVFTACPLDGRMRPELRETLARQLGSLPLGDVTLYPASLTQDPQDDTRYYVAADLDWSDAKQRFDSGRMLVFSGGTDRSAPAFPDMRNSASYEVEASRGRYTSFRSAPQIMPIWHTSSGRSRRSFCLGRRAASPQSRAATGIRRSACPRRSPLFNRSCAARAGMSPPPCSFRPPAR